MAEDNGLLRVVTPAAVNEYEEEKAKLQQEMEEPEAPVVLELVTYIRGRFQHARNQRNSERISDTLLDCLRTYRGIYPPEVRQQVEQFGGSDVYSRITSTKCRGAAALLRDVYLSGDRPWDVESSPQPNLPDDIASAISGLVAAEVQNLEGNQQPLTPAAIQERMKGLSQAAEISALKEGKDQADRASRVMDDVLVEGNFYEALDEFLLDLTIFPIAILKGPVVKMTDTIRWEEGKLVESKEPKMHWYRVSPFDLHFSPGANKVEESETFEHIQYTKAELLTLAESPGFNKEDIMEILYRYQFGGLVEWYDDTIESERTDLETRENIHQNQTKFIHGLEYRGYAPGQFLLDAGLTEDAITDPSREYFVQAWIVDDLLIKVGIDPSPRKVPPYYITSFQKIPGAIYGEGLVQILSDVQSVANSTMRALVNNLSIASGPQVIIDEDQMAETEDTDELFPWKRWHVQSDPLGNKARSQKAVDFHQPQSNAQELLQVYQAFNTMADEISAIPRYMHGGGSTGGAGRTASGLAMLMNNASKVMQSVAGNIDKDVIARILQNLYDYIMLTDESGLLQGDENIVVKGVTTAVQKEQDRVRQLEFLQLTGNPVDLNLLGPKGRAALLRSVAENLGMEYEDVVPDPQLTPDVPMPPPDGGEGQPPTPGNQAAPGGGGDASQPHMNTVGTRNTV